MSGKKKEVIPVKEKIVFVSDNIYSLKCSVEVKRWV